MLTENDKKELEQQLMPSKVQIDAWESRIIFLSSWIETIKEKTETETDSIKRFEMLDKVYDLEQEVKAKQIAINRRRAFIQSQVNHRIEKAEKEMIKTHYPLALRHMREQKVSAENMILKKAIEDNARKGYKSFEDQKNDFNKLIEVFGYNANLV